MKQHSPTVIVDGSNAGYDMTNWYDGLSVEVSELVARSRLTRQVHEAINTAHTDKWCELLEAAGFHPYRCGTWEVETAVKAGWIRQDNIVEPRDSDGLDPYWQKAWDELDSNEVALSVLPDHWWFCVWEPTDKRWPRNGIGRWVPLDSVRVDTDLREYLNGYLSAADTEPGMYALFATQNQMNYGADDEAVEIIDIALERTLPVYRIQAFVHPNRTIPEFFVQADDLTEAAALALKVLEAASDGETVFHVSASVVRGET